jgi:hypothetical protein
MVHKKIGARKTYFFWKQEKNILKWELTTISFVFWKVSILKYMYLFKYNTGAHHEQQQQLELA